MMFCIHYGLWLIPLSSYVVSAAKAAKSSDANVKQRLVYISSVGSDPKSRLLYLKYVYWVPLFPSQFWCNFKRTKGLTEQELASIGYSDTIVFRPGVLQDRGESRGPIVSTAEYAFSFIYYQVLKYTVTGSWLASSLNSRILLAFRWICWLKRRSMLENSALKTYPPRSRLTLSRFLRLQSSR